MTSASTGPPMPYAAIASVDVAALRWIRAEGGHHDFELRSGDTAVAKLSLSPERGGPARAESIEGRYTIDRAGFLRPRLTLRRDGSSTVLARLVSGPEGLPARHAIEIADARLVQELYQGPYPAGRLAMNGLMALGLPAARPLFIHNALQIIGG